MEVVHTIRYGSSSPKYENEYEAMNFMAFLLYVGLKDLGNQRDGSVESKILIVLKNKILRQV